MIELTYEIPETGTPRPSLAPHMQERLPKVTPAAYVKTPEGYEGLDLTNEGTPAYDVQLEPISLKDGWRVRFDQISRLARGGFARSWTSRDNHSILSPSGLWRDLPSQPAILPLVIRYRDFEGRCYRSIGELHRDVMKKSGFDVKFIRQE